VWSRSSRNCRACNSSANRLLCVQFGTPATRFVKRVQLRRLMSLEWANLGIKLVLATNFSRNRVNMCSDSKITVNVHFKVFDDVCFSCFVAANRQCTARTPRRMVRCCWRDEQFLASFTPLRMNVNYPNSFGDFILLGGAVSPRISKKSKVSVGFWDRVPPNSKLRAKHIPVRSIWCAVRMSTRVKLFPEYRQGLRGAPNSEKLI
jgi:hypothetical protein